MTTRPIPVPPKGAEVKWHLSPPYSARHLLWLVLIVALLLVTGQRTDMDRMVAMTTQAVGNLIGVADDSQVVRGLSRVGTAMWPPVIGEVEEVNRMGDLDRDRLPLFSYIEVQERVEQRMNLETLQLEAATEQVEVLVKPLGYVWTVFVKMVETLEIALWGTLLSVVLSIPLAYFAARNYSANRFTYTAARGFISLLRSVPELIVALFLVLAYGFGPIAGVLALGLHAAGFLGKFYAEDIENADKKPQEALEAIGAGKIKTLWYGVLPQVLPQYIAYTAYIMDRNLRMATVVGLVGAGGIGQELKGRFDMFQYGHVMTILIAIFIFVFLLDQLQARIRARLI
ncbi:MULTISPECIES: phosphonate ABC transporter, permease protein PhnE [unclassified Halomonas]|uniref:phosphonate ABC transporter, permease protein PhnE n=1 Tax=unclassified Halomonas TaxID=2609666 RepID=UPI000D71D01B|nr:MULTISPECIES: phosphonate ABC transporter, permease protein PhnE [unclassified Halomonas]PWV78791.1 phosphonate transport system permease protein [Halomonas sp. A11-A]QJQ97299.1 phosphonate ABC transporter, permease protein PhnE [Halomonas sp. PGE1]